MVGVYKIRKQRGVDTSREIRTKASREGTAKGNGVGGGARVRSTQVGADCPDCETPVWGFKGVATFKRVRSSPREVPGLNIRERVAEAELLMGSLTWGARGVGATRISV